MTDITESSDEQRKFAFDFHMREYDRLIQEINARYKFTLDMEKYGIVSLAALYVWIFSKLDAAVGLDAAKKYVIWIPVIVAFVVATRRRTNRRNIIRLREYISEIEKLYRIETGEMEGWETRQLSRLKAITFRTGMSITWTSIFVGTLLVAVLWQAGILGVGKPN